jgi:protein-tyrosine phosphatase
MAEALLKDMLSRRGINSIGVSSCGLQASPWNTAEARIGIVIGDAYKLLGDFRSRPISPELVRDADLILTMEERQVREILARFPSAKGKVHTVTRFVGEGGEIPDFLDGNQKDLLEWLKDSYSTLGRCLGKVADKVSRANSPAGLTDSNRKAS